MAIVKLERLISTSEFTLGKFDFQGIRYYTCEDAIRLKKIPKITTMVISPIRKMACDHMERSSCMDLPLFSDPEMEVHSLSPSNQPVSERHLFL